MNRIIALAALALALAACFNPTFNNPTCGPNGECPSGTTCVQNICREDGADVDAAIDSSMVDPDAMADAATDAPTDGTPIDTPIDAAMTCPNGMTEGTEQCDDNNSTNTDDCTAICRFNVCGDGHTDTVGSRTDTCDDGNAVNTDNCVGITSGGVTQCRISACGDGFTDMVAPGIEQCDDGNMVNNDSCLNNCTLNLCGNGVIEGSETCDDDNTLACGTCNSTCGAVIPPRAATGSITCALGGTQQDGETFTLSDGFNPPTVFEWDRTGNFLAGRVPVTYNTGMGQGQMADAAAMAISSVGTTLLITIVPRVGGPTVDLFHDRQTSLGNQAITDTVSNSTFVVTGMSGGAAGDCSAGTGCTVNDDCSSGVCTGGSCQ